MKCEIEFLPVGSGSKPGDAIVIRYGEPNSYELMIVDGGTLECGDELVKHVQSYFPGHTVTHVVLTHPDADHASGLRTVLENLIVFNLWMHVPWIHAASAMPYFENKNWTPPGLSENIRKEYDIISDIYEVANAHRVQIFEPFAGSVIGPFTVLSPHRIVYDLLLPQFKRTPAPDQVAIKAQGFWIDEQKPPLLFGALFERAVVKVQKWIPENWATERLRDGGVTSATNETSVVLYGAFEQGPVLLTGDAGNWGLTLAAHYAEQSQLPLRQFSFIQVPHHGSRRNVGPTILNRLVGPIQPQGTESRFNAFISAPRDDDTHPRKMVVNAFIRRGGTVVATQGLNKIYYGGFPPRPSYVDAQRLNLASQVEDYD